MWVYRISHAYPTDDLHEIVLKTDIVPYTAIKRLWHHIDWDGTIDGPVLRFNIPGMFGPMVGFLIKDHAGRTFIGSPIQLLHIEKLMDWDAHTSDEEIARAVKAIVHGEIKEHKPLLIRPWSVSAKGNRYTTINGVNLTIYATRDQQYQAIVNPIGRSAIRTPLFQTQKACQNYVVKHFYDIIDPKSADPYPVTDYELDDW